ncbi:MAG: tetratricopeptide repeat protein [Acidobacteriota bacterium]
MTLETPLSRRFFLPAFVVLLLLVSAGAPRAATAQLAAQAERWLAVTTPHFEVVGNLERRRVEAYAADLEVLHAALRQLNAGREMRPKVPYRVFLLADADWFAAYAPRRMSAAGTGRSSGYFHATQYFSHLVIRADPAAKPRQTLLHESLHAFLHDHLPEAPLWLNEGLAELYSTLVLDEEGYAVLGGARSSHLRTLQQRSLLPLRTLLETSTDTRLYHQGERRAVFYAQSWALVHHLLLGREDGSLALRDFLSALVDGEAPLTAFVGSFQTSVQSLEDELSSYTTAPLPRVRFPVDLQGVEIEAARTLTPADALVRLGELCTELGSRDEARRHFDAALALAPDHSRALAGFGRLAEAAGDLGKAEAWYAQAVEANTRDPWSSFLLGNVIVRDAVERQYAEEIATPRVRVARAALRASVKRQPSFGPAWAALGLAGLLGPAPPGDGEIRALRTARDLMPRRADVVYHQALAHARRQEWQQARALIEGPLERLADLDTIDEAYRALAQSRVEQAAALVDAGAPTAEALLDDLESDPDPALSELAPRLAEVRRVFDYNRAVELYNSGVEAARDGRVADARASLDDVLRVTDDRELRRAARRLLEALDR